MLTGIVALPPDEPRTRRSNKSRLYPHTALPPEAVEHWNTVLMPQINQALCHFYRKNPESVEISLESVGDSAKETKPTVLVVCTSVSKVKGILRRKMGAFFDGTTGYALKVCRGSVLRSRLEGTGTKRSMAHPESADVATAANGGFQERPLNGASIGAWVGDRHLPPVSFGGLVVVDNKTYGMTVHHMLDDPDAEQGLTAVPKGSEPIQRSTAGSMDPANDLAAWYAQQYPDDSSPASGDSSDSEDFAAEFSEAESEETESAVTSEYDESDEGEEEDEYSQPGDIPGIDPGCGEGYIISQPALDDVEEGFYASPETQDEEHIDTFSLGEVFASSGIRRRNDERGLIHEIDWALFEFKDDRLPGENSMPRALNAAERPIHPSSVLPTTALPNLEVQCVGRTSGLQAGRIMPALTSVKIYGRTSPSHTYQVTSIPSEKSSDSNNRSTDKSRRSLPLGLPGDSGAWVVERKNGQVCGHVLAFSQRKKVAYICPMDVMLLDIAETLEAAEVRLPGGKPVVRMVGDGQNAGYHEPLVCGGNDDDNSDVDVSISRSMAAAKRRSLRKGKGSVRIQPREARSGIDRPASMAVGSSGVSSGPMCPSSRPKSIGVMGAVGEVTEDMRNMSLASSGNYSSSMWSD